MANEDHLNTLKQGSPVWNQWRRDNEEISPDLSSADLRKVDLSWADLSDANLSGADLVEADLSWAVLSGANLSKANLFDAYLNHADLTEADLSEAYLDDADLSEAYLYGAHLKGASLYGAKLYGAYFIESNLTGADLSNSILVETDLEHAELTNCRVYGISAWNVNLTGAIQKDLVITRDDEPALMVDDLEVAQFIYLLLHHDKLRNVLNAVAEKGVLVLGRFSNDGIKTLRAIGERLRELGYLPIIFDFERPTEHDYTETVKTLVGLSRFVIAELSGPSVPYELGSTVFGFERPFSLILEKGQEPFFMSRDLAKYPWVLQPVIEFESQEELLDLLQERIVAPAEAYIKNRQHGLSERDPH